MRFLHSAYSARHALIIRTVQRHGSVERLFTNLRTQLPISRLKSPTQHLLGVYSPERSPRIWASRSLRAKGQHFRRRAVTTVTSILFALRQYSHGYMRGPSRLWSEDLGGAFPFVVTQ